MRLIKLTFLFILLISFTGCRFIREKGWFGGKKKAALEEEMMRQDSLERADSIRMVEVMRQRRLDDSLAQVQMREQELMKKYNVILGSFKVPENAANYLQFVRNQGFDAEIIMAPNHWHLVAAERFDNRRDAFRRVRAFHDELRDAWVYARE